MNNALTEENQGKLQMNTPNRWKDARPSNESQLFFFFKSTLNTNQTFSLSLERGS